MNELSEQQMAALDRATEPPPRVADPVTKDVAVLLKAADFDWLRGLLPDEPDAARLTDPRTKLIYALVPLQRYERFMAFFEHDPITPSERAAQVRAWGKRAGWDDPAFDLYDAIASA